MSVELNVKIVGETPDEIREQFADLAGKPLVSVNGSAPAESSVAVAEAPENGIARKKIDIVWGRVGPNIRKLLSAAASFENGYQTEDLARKMKVSKVQLRAYAANLGRTSKSVNRALGDNTPIYQWDERHGKWVMPESIRQAVLAKTK